MGALTKLNQWNLKILKWKNKMAGAHTCIAKKHVISSSLKARVENRGNRKTLKFSFTQTFVDTNDS